MQNLYLNRLDNQLLSFKKNQTFEIYFNHFQITCKNYGIPILAIYISLDRTKLSLDVP